MKIKYTTIALAILATLTLCGCGKAGSDTATSAPDTSPPPVKLPTMGAASTNAIIPPASNPGGNMGAAATNNSANSNRATGSNP